VAESVDATDLKSVGRKAVPVRVRARAPNEMNGLRLDAAAPVTSLATLDYEQATY
jgi:hypothetical protein